jgi:hypothetical protein
MVIDFTDNVVTDLVKIGLNSGKVNSYINATY